MLHSQGVLAQHFDCTDRLLRPGDVLYLPRGVPHIAHTSNSSLTLHVTLALAQQDATFPELVEAACAAIKGDMAAQLAACETWLPAWHQNVSRGVLSADAIPFVTLAADARKRLSDTLMVTDNDIWEWFSDHIYGAARSSVRSAGSSYFLANDEVRRKHGGTLEQAHADVKQPGRPLRKANCRGGGTKKVCESKLSTLMTFCICTH